MEDLVCYYLERDFLGRVSNLHLRYCDKLGPKGPMDPKALNLSKLQAIAVDFAKHGKCIQLEDFEEVAKAVGPVRPDFLESRGKKKESQGILGKLYRMTDITKAYEACLKLDH
jgi:hypothetical protein